MDIPLLQIGISTQIWYINRNPATVCLKIALVLVSGGYYIDRDEIPFFQSVILSGVYDVKNLKRRFVAEDDHKTNIPWNIAADFHVDLSFGTAEIAGMLDSYEQDFHTGMDTLYIARLIHDYTSGYPFLVSSICKLVDERIVRRTFTVSPRAWTREDILDAVRILLSDRILCSNL